MPRHKHIGSDFDDLLREDALLEEVNALAQKRLLALQLRDVMRERRISESALAKRMSTSRTAVRNLLDPENDSATLISLARAAAAIGHELHIELIPHATKRRRRPEAAKRIGRHRS